MAILPDLIPKQSSGASASYDYVDLANGLGYETFYGVSQNFPPSSIPPYTTANPQYFLMSGIATSLYPRDSTNGTLTQTTTSATLNFDTSAFNLPRTVRGNAIVNFLCRNLQATSTNCTFSAQLKKVLENGNTEDLSSVFTLDFNGNNAPANAMAASSSQNFLAQMALTERIIKKGEKIRLTVIVTDVDNENIGVYHDPLGRNLVSDTNFSTQMKAMIPFRIDAS